MSEETRPDTKDDRSARTVGEVHALRCADCARSDSLVEGVEPTSRVPIPAEALAGFPDGVPRPPAGRHSRRTFLLGTAIGTAAVYSAARLSWESVWNAASASAATPSADTILVCIYLNGGNDGLNAIVPVSNSQYSGYLSQRQNIARVLGPSTGGRVGTTVMPGTGGTLAFANPLVSGAGNNGAPVGLDTLYGSGSGSVGSDLAIFPAADYRPANLSHFESRDYWFAGALEEMETGWLGRWLDRYGSATNPLQAVSIDTSLSKSIRSETAPVCAISDLSDTSFQVAGANANPQISTLAAIPASHGNQSLGRARAIYGETVQVSHQVSGLNGHLTVTGYPPKSDLSSKLQLAATLLSAGLGTRIVTIDWGSFDTHGAQIGSQDPQLAVLSQALGAFKADLIARGIEQRVLTLVYSEFGRRIGSNDSLGTDHGAGGLVMVSGSSVLGGLAGEHPGVQGDENDNLVPITDFRTVYQALISEWLGGDPTAILPSGPFPGIQRYDGATRLLK
jgi:uncharacterized protein (DUF1501 family)